MCNHILASGRACRIASKLQFCHIHKFDFKLVEISNLNNTIQKKSIKHKNELAELQKTNDKILSNSETIFGENLDLILESREFILEIENLKKDNDSLKKENERMKQNNNDYKVLRQYESAKNELLKKGIDIFTYHNDGFHALRLQRNIIAHKTY